MNDSSPSHTIVPLDARSFDAVIQRGVVLVDFSEPWCGPCHMQVPILERVAERIGQRAVVATVNVDEAPRLAAHYLIESIPTLLLFKHGKLIRAFVGVHSEATLVAVIEEAVGPPPAPESARE